MINKFIISITLLAVAFFIPNAAQTQSKIKRINVKDYWSIFKTDKECWIASAPISSSISENGRPVNAKRSDMLLFVTYNKSLNIDGEISYTGGFPFASDKNIKLNIGNENFAMISQGEWAWTRNAANDTKIRIAMKRGYNAIISSYSTRGKLIKDTFSLIGFTAALNDAKKRCQ